MKLIKLAYALAFLITAFSFQIAAQNKCLSNAEAKQVLNSVNSSQNQTLNKSLRDELVKMQKARQKVNQEIIDESQKNERYIAEADAMGEKQLLRLCEIVKQNGWVTKESVDEDGVAAVSFILENSKTAALQKEILPVLVAASKKGLITNRSIAYLIDSIRIANNQPQIFGTQTEIRDELFYLYPIQNEAKVDELRKIYGLLPMKEFYQYAQSWYQMPVIKMTDEFAFGRERATPIKTPDAASVNNSQEDEAINVDSNVVNLNVKVEGADSSVSVPSLEKKDFEVYENDKEQKISFFEKNAPFDLILMVDDTGRTKHKKDWIYKAAQRFTDAARPSDRVAIFSLSSAYNKDTGKSSAQRIFSNLSSNRADLEKTTAVNLGRGESSGVWSEIQFVFDHIIKPQNQGRRSAVIYITSDWDANLSLRYNQRDFYYSNTTFTELLETIRNGETTIIPVFLEYRKETMELESNVRRLAADGEDRVAANAMGTIVPWFNKAMRQGERTISIIADESGGQVYPVRKLEDLDGVYEQVIGDLSKVYGLGYEPNDAKRDGTWRGISVKIKNQPSLKARTRKGYYAK